MRSDVINLAPCKLRSYYYCKWKCPWRHPDHLIDPSNACKLVRVGEGRKKKEKKKNV